MQGLYPNSRQTPLCSDGSAWSSLPTHTHSQQSGCSELPALRHNSSPLGPHQASLVPFAPTPFPTDHSHNQEMCSSCDSRDDHPATRGLWPYSHSPLNNPEYYLPKDNKTADSGLLTFKTVPGWGLPLSRVRVSFIHILPAQERSKLKV